MDKHTLDFDLLDKSINGPKTIKLADVSDQIKKVAFDVVTFRNDPETLWRVVSGEDGDEYIVAMYPEQMQQKEASVQKEAASKPEMHWSVEMDRTGKSATIFYKNTPITNIHVQAALIEDVDDFKYRVPQLLNKSASLVKKMLGGLESSYRNRILGMYPELQ
jgi:hypothetical protein